MTEEYVVQRGIKKSSSITYDGDVNNSLKEEENSFVISAGESIFS